MGSSGLVKKSVNRLANLYKAFNTMSGITVITMIIFLFAITSFYYTLCNVKMDWVECNWFKEKWRNNILGFGTTAIFAIVAKGVKGLLQWQLIKVFMLVISLTYVVVVLVNYSVLQQPYEFLLAMDSGTIVVTICITISAIRHDAFEE